MSHTTTEAVQFGSSCEVIGELQNFCLNSSMLQDLYTASKCIEQGKSPL